MASGTSAPSASRQASAEASVQPVPWVCRLSTRAARVAEVTAVLAPQVVDRVALAVTALDQHPLRAAARQQRRPALLPGSESRTTGQQLRPRPGSG